MAFSSDGKWLASGGYEKTIQSWDLASGQEVRQWSGPEGNISSLAFSPDGKLLASGGLFDQNVHLWEAATGRNVDTLEGLPKGASSLAFSPDGKVLAAGGYHTDEIYLWKSTTGTPIGQLAGSPVVPPITEMPSRSQPDFSYVAFAPDGKTLVSGHLHGLIRIWDMGARRERRHFRGPTDDVFVHLAFSPDGQNLASWGTSIRLWQAGGWKKTREFGEQAELRISCVAFSPDGRMVASGSSGRDTGDDMVHLWELATGTERCRLAGHQYAIASVAFSPDGATLVSGSRDGTALVWDLKKLPQQEPARTDLSKEELDKRWRELAGSDAARAYRALGDLVRDPRRTVHFLKARLQPVFRDEPQRISELIAALDSGSFKERQEATAQLGLQVEVHEPAVRQALSGQHSPEARRRLEHILRTRREARFSARQLQMLRALEVLEYIGSSEAKEVLEALTKGTPEFRITREARASLDRLAKRSSGKPRSDSRRASNSLPHPGSRYFAAALLNSKEAESRIR